MERCNKWNTTRLCPGTILFVLYINDLPDVIHTDTNTYLFADNTKVFRAILKPED
jgi:hypothetical protein